MTKKKIAYLEIRSRTFTTTKYTFFLRKNTSLKGVYRSFLAELSEHYEPGNHSKDEKQLECKSLEV